MMARGVEETVQLIGRAAHHNTTATTSRIVTVMATGTEAVAWLTSRCAYLVTTTNVCRIVTDTTMTCTVEGKGLQQNYFAKF